MIKKVVTFILNLIILMVFLFFTFEVFPKLLSGNTLEVIMSLVIFVGLLSCIYCVIIKKERKR